MNFINGENGFLCGSEKLGGGGSQNGGMEIGQLIYVSSIDLSDGLIPLIPSSVIVGGAIDNPILAKRHPWIVDPQNANNFKMPSWLGKVHIANLASLAANDLGRYFSDSTAVNGLSVSQNGGHSHSILVPNSKDGNPDGGDDRGGSSADQYWCAGSYWSSTGTSGQHGHSLSGDSETAPRRFLMLYALVGDKFGTNSNKSEGSIAAAAEVSALLD